MARKAGMSAAQRQIEQDLCVLTGPRLLAKYGDPTSSKYLSFVEIVGEEPAATAISHNPFWYYLQQVWFDKPVGRALLCKPHRDLADRLLKFALGEYDEKDGFHYEFPRRGLKSTILEGFADWIPKFHKINDGIDISVLYTHNVEKKATRRLSLIKHKNRKHKYIKDVFPLWVIPDGEWGTKSEWSWPTRDQDTSVAEESMTAMSAAAKKAGDGYNYKLLDDWEDEDSRSSPVIREEISACYDQLRALKAVPFSREVSEGTPYCLNGLYRPMVEAKHADGTLRYEVFRVPALDDNDQPNFPGIPALTVEGLAKERANEIQRTGSDIFWYLQYQLEPRLTGTQAMEWAWWRELTPAEFQKKFARLPRLRCIYVDSAWKGSEKQTKGDATSIQVVDTYQIAASTERVILDHVWSREMTSDEGAEEICRLMKKWGTTYYAIEQAGEDTFYGVMKVVSRSRFIYPTKIDLKGWTKKKKEQRISAVAGAARMGAVYYLAGLPELDTFKQEVGDYPENRRSPNCLDAFANSFAETVVRGWVPVAVDEYQPKRTILDIPEPEYISATRYTNVPVFH